MEEFGDLMPLIIGLLLTVGVGYGLYQFVVRYYRLASKEMAFVRTGLFGEKVVMNGGTFVFPHLQTQVNVNMKTLRLEVRREAEQALITRDRMRIDVIAEFYVRVKNDEISVATAARTLGLKTLNQNNELSDLVEGKFVDALRAVAAEMGMKELHEKRSDFIQKVQLSVSEDLTKNGLELETVSLTGLDQTHIDYFNPENAFDAEGLVRLTEITEARKKERNDIERNTELAMKAKDLETEQNSLKLDREQEYARLAQEREIAVRRAEQKAAIELYEIEKQMEIDLKRIEAEREIHNESIRTQQAVTLTEQERVIAIAEKSRAESAAKAQADKARAAAVLEEEAVHKVRETERAERAKAVQLIVAQEEAQKAAIAVKVSAAAEKQAAIDRAEAAKIAALGEAEAKLALAKAQEEQYRVDAEGTEALNKAANLLSEEQIEMQVRLNTLKHLPDIIRESVKPMENIDEIKILQVNGMGGFANGGTGQQDNPNVSLSDQMVNSALRYRSQAPLVDGLLKEIGLTGGDINGMTQNLQRLMKNDDDNVIEQMTHSSTKETENPQIEHIDDGDDKATNVSAN